MHPLSILTLQAILAASVAAQDTIADIWVYSTDKCKDEAFSGSLDLSLYESNKVLTGEKWTCMYAQTDLVGFEDSGTQYTIYVDENTIPDDCSLVLYQGAPRDDSLNQGECQTYYATISNKDGGCVETKIAKEFGYALCCGDDCAAATSPPPAKKRETESEVAKPAPRDVSTIKRGNPFAQKREDCSFSGEGDAVMTYGPQVRIGPSNVNCPAGASDCSNEVELQYESSVSTTIGMSSSLGASLFEVISASVTFSVETTHEESHSYSWKASASIPEGQSGYLTFAPRLACTPNGKFSGGDCKGAPTDKEGRVCYQTLNFGNPDGAISFVQDV